MQSPWTRTASELVHELPEGRPSQTLLSNRLVKQRASLKGFRPIEFAPQRSASAALASELRKVMELLMESRGLEALLERQVRPSVALYGSSQVHRPALQLSARYLIDFSTLGA